jgi:hypothetical protein
MGRAKTRLSLNARSEIIKIMTEYHVPSERIPKQVVAALTCVSGWAPDAPVVLAMQLGQGRPPTVTTLVEAVKRMSLPGLTEDVVHSIHGMENADDTLQTRYPRENSGSVMDPDEGVDMELLHFFLDHVMPNPGLGQARVVIEEEPSSSMIGQNRWRLKMLMSQVASDTPSCSRMLWKGRRCQPP